MLTKLNRLLDVLSDYFAHRKGLIPIISIFIILLNFILQFFNLGWIADSNLFLHLGIIVAIFGFILAWAL